MAWARRNQPQRRRATYHRRKGTEQFFGFYDVHADCLDGLFRKRKRLPELFDAFERLRRCYPGKKLYVITDNLHQVHDHPRFLALLKQLRIHPVWTPTEASWLNLIEGPLRRAQALHPGQHRRPRPHHPTSPCLSLSALPPPQARDSGASIDRDSQS